ncbi:hypothetical protein [Jannaschia donghaensis]|uniref:Tellurite resistance protein TerB n=1 Tax=Jannaschia donghaensis TaxID=420998 RepID=A0A0M6YIY4_9RHOB|nr:hypothetical protein [Jannaschia donghaensis]CTQ49026.1 hypothetical protein JDO7802_01034 [Jannaschia donghaensis]
MKTVVLRPVAALALSWPVAVHAKDHETSTTFLGPLTLPLQRLLPGVEILPWLAGCLAIIAVVLLLIHRARLARRKVRVGIAGLSNGPRFRVVDAMAHAVWKGRGINEQRLSRALEIARDTTDMDFSKDHLREIALRTDRIIFPSNFRWMRDGLTQPERMVIFNSTLSVLLTDGPLTRSDRSFLRTVARGLGLKDKDLRHLAHLIAT